MKTEHEPQSPFASGSPDNADASTLRLALRVPLGDRPLRMAARVNRHAAGARLRRARRALARRRADGPCRPHRRTGSSP